MKNQSPNAVVAADLAAAAQESAATVKPAQRFEDFPYRTPDRGSRELRVVGEAQWMTHWLAEVDDAAKRLRVASERALPRMSKVSVSSRVATTAGRVADRNAFDSPQNPPPFLERQTPRRETC